MNGCTLKCACSLSASSPLAGKGGGNECSDWRCQGLKYVKSGLRVRENRVFPLHAALFLYKILPMEAMNAQIGAAKGSKTLSSFAAQNCRFERCCFRYTKLQVSDRLTSRRFRYMKLQVCCSGCLFLAPRIRQTVDRILRSISAMILSGFCQIFCQNYAYVIHA